MLRALAAPSGARKATAAVAAELRGRLSRASPAERPALLEPCVREIVDRALGRDDRAPIDPDRPLDEYALFDWVAPDEDEFEDDAEPAPSSPNG